MYPITMLHQMIKITYPHVTSTSYHKSKSFQNRLFRVYDTCRKMISQKCDGNTLRLQEKQQDSSLHCESLAKHTKRGQLPANYSKNCAKRLAFAHLSIRRQSTHNTYKESPSTKESQKSLLVSDRVDMYQVSPVTGAD